MAILDYYTDDSFVDTNQVISQEFYFYTAYWDKLQFQNYQDFLNQPYIIVNSISEYKKLEQQAYKRKEKLNKH